MKIQTWDLHPSQTLSQLAGEKVYTTRSAVYAPEFTVVEKKEFLKLLQFAKKLYRGFGEARPSVTDMAAATDFEKYLEEIGK